MKINSVKLKATQIFLSLIVLMSAIVMPLTAVAEEVQESELNWIEGTGQTVKLDAIAELTLPEFYIFLDKQNTIDYIEGFQGLPTYEEIGYVYAFDENSEWEVYFEYTDSGYIEDNEKSDINAKELLKSYERGQKEANKELPEHNHLFVDGWFIEPVYNESLRSLTWALLLHDNNGEQLINYNVRILTRTGYISAILVSTPENLDSDRKTFEEELLPGLTVNPGKTYADFDPKTDKKSSFGLSGLILGGAGLAVAKKTGILAVLAVILKKAWFLLILPFIWIGRLFKKKNKGYEPSGEDVEINPEFNPDTTLNTDSGPNAENQGDDRFKSKFDLENEDKKPPTSM